MIRKRKLHSFWAVWKDKIIQTRNKPEQKYWNCQIQINIDWVKQITRNIKHRKENEKYERQKNNDLEIKAQIEQIKAYRENGDLPSVLKEFSKLSRKHYISITELKGNDDGNIANPEEIWRKIDKHIEDILHDANVYQGETKFAESLTQNNINTNMIKDGENPEI